MKYIPTKKFCLLLFCVLRQSSHCLHRSKLAWDAEAGWQNLRAFYAGENRRYLTMAIEGLLDAGIAPVVQGDLTVARTKLQKRFGSRWYNLLSLILPPLSALRQRFQFQMDEAEYILACLLEFADRVDNPVPPSASEGQRLCGYLRSADYCVEARSWFMPAFAKAHRIVRTPLPPIGPWYLMKEILRQIE